MFIFLSNFITKINTNKIIYKYFLALLLSVFIFICVLCRPTTSFAWYSNPYPNPGGTLDCTYNAWIKDNIYHFKIVSGGGKIKWLQALNIVGQANWSFPLIVNWPWPEGSWPEGYIKDPNTDAETFTEYSPNDSFAFQDGGPGAWSMQIIPDGEYHVPFTGNLNISDLSISFWTIDNLWSKPCEFVTSTPTPTSTPIPTLTPTPTPTPSPTPQPVNKIVFAPGITASWNVDALINCKTNPTGDWILAPYAESVYNPILQSFKNNGWGLLEFYYDWRKIPLDIAYKLESFISSKTKIDEKVNFVGHSMGGLVGKDYLDNTYGNKLNSFLSIGTPYRGSALSYAPWEGAETWSNNLFEKIAVTLYLKHCGGLSSNGLEIVHSEIPSLQSLLPVEPYLQYKNNSTTYLPNDENNRNNWFFNTNSDFSGVRSGNIAGTGFETLKIIQTKTPNKKDYNRGLWVDGSPAGKITSLKGDGTVLVDSALMGTADENILVNQSHRDLVSSQEGIDAIMSFFGMPKGYAELNFNNELEKPNSALILIGYPATFSVIDKNGNIKSDKQGMVAIMNPETGNYKLNIFSRSNETVFIIAQYLPNGDLKYKEYKFKGIGPKFKNINFNSESPQEDILK